MMGCIRHCRPSDVTAIAAGVAASTAGCRAGTACRLYILHSSTRYAPSPCLREGAPSRGDRWPAPWSVGTLRRKVYMPACARRPCEAGTHLRMLHAGHCLWCIVCWHDAVGVECDVPTLPRPGEGEYLLYDVPMYSAKTRGGSDVAVTSLHPVCPPCVGFSLGSRVAGGWLVWPGYGCLLVLAGRRAVIGGGTGAC